MQMTPPGLSSASPPAAQDRADRTGGDRLDRPIRHRSRTGCLTCRTRKVKCDETQPVCQNCKRCALACTWPVVEDVLSSRARRRLQQQQRRRRREVELQTDTTEREKRAEQRVEHDVEENTIMVRPAESNTTTTEGRQTGEAVNGASNDTFGTIPTPTAAAALITPVTPTIHATCSPSYATNENGRQAETDPVYTSPAPAEQRQRHEPEGAVGEATDVRATITATTQGPLAPTAPSAPLAPPPGSQTRLRDDNSNSLNLNISKGLVLQHIDAFFRYIYPCQANGFVHRGTLMRHFYTGTVNRKVLLAICAVASRFVPADDPVRGGGGPDMQPDHGQQRGPNSACRAAIAAQADAWAKESKTLLVLEDMTLDTVVSALLLARHDIHNGLFGSAWMLSSMATRAALALGLNRENHSLYRHQQNAQNAQNATMNANIPFSEQETRRRLFWACYCLDRMMSTGLSDLTTLRAEHISLQLPCEEHHYLYGTSCWTTVPRLEWAREWEERGHDRDVGDDDDNDDDFSSSGGESDGEGNGSPPLYDPLLESERDIGLFGRYVQIMEMRYCILHYVRNRYKASKAHTNSTHQRAQQQFRRHPRSSTSTLPPPPWSPSSWFARCKRKLTRWKRALPPQLQLLPDTVYARHAQDQLSALVMLHVWYDQCMSDLYRITMPGFPETLPADQLRKAPPGWVQQQQQACVRHSTNIVTTLEMVAGIIEVDRCAPGSGRKEGCGGEYGGGRKHRGRRGFVFLDASLPMCVFDSIRVQLQWLFMQLPTADPAVAEARRLQCKENCEKLMGFVKGMTKYFSQAQWLLEEMRRMLQRHDVPTHQTANLFNTDSPSSDGGGHPWQRRIQQLQDDDVVQSGSGASIGPAPTATVSAHNYASLDAAVNLNLNMTSNMVSNMTAGLSTTMAPDDVMTSTTAGEMPSSQTALGGTTMLSLAQYSQNQQTGQTQQTQKVLHGFSGNTNTAGSSSNGLYDNSMSTMQMPLFGWDEMLVLPDLAGLMGNNGDWMANGVLHEDEPSIPMLGVERP